MKPRKSFVNASKINDLVFRVPSVSNSCPIWSITNSIFNMTIVIFYITTIFSQNAKTAKKSIKSRKNHRIHYGNCGLILVPVTGLELVTGV